MGTFLEILLATALLLAGLWLAKECVEMRAEQKRDRGWTPIAEIRDESPMAEVDLPLAFPLHLLVVPGAGSYLSAELSPGSVALLLTRDRRLAERFATANGIEAVRIVGAARTEMEYFSVG